MKFTVYATGYCYDNGKPTQKAGCAAYLVAEDELGRVGKRTISQPTGNSTLPRSELSAARLALSSIKKKFQGSPVTAFFSRYAASALEAKNGGYKVNPKKNKEEIESLRSLSDIFSNLQVKIGSKEQFKECLEAAKVCANNQAAEDTDTQVSS